jgi:hypothetical protein
MMFLQLKFNLQCRTRASSNMKSIVTALCWNVTFLLSLQQRYFLHAVDVTRVLQDKTARLASVISGHNARPIRCGLVNCALQAL